MLGDHPIHASLAASDVQRARAWYADKLGMIPTLEFDGVLVYRVGRSTMTVYASRSAGTAKNTVAVWKVPDLRAEVERLRARGVVFEDYDQPEFDTEDGIAEFEGGGRLAWFKDSEGNTVVLAESPGDTGPPSIAPMIAAADLVRAKAWYADKLALQPIKEIGGDLVYASGDSTFTVYLTEFASTAENTVAVWRVPDLRAEVADLRARGVTLEDYDLGEARTVDGVMTDDDGSLLAWFKDPDGNVLGLVEDAETRA